MILHNITVIQSKTRAPKQKLSCGGTKSKDLSYRTGWPIILPMLSEAPTMTRLLHALVALAFLGGAGCETTSPFPAAGSPGPSAEFLDSFALAGAWDMDPFGTTGSVTFVDNRMEVSFHALDAAPRDKCVVSIPVRMSLANRAGVLVDADNHFAESVELAFGLQTHDEDYYETRPVPLRPGLNPNICFSLETPTYKSAETEWQHSTAPKGLASTKRLFLLIYAKQAGSVAFSNFRIMSARKTQQPDDVGLLPVLQNGKWGYCDRAARIVISPSFTRALAFREGLAPVVVNNRFGYINARGETVIAPHYESAGAFSEQLASVMVSGKFGYIDTAGAWVIQPSYNEAFAFRDGLARIGTGDAFSFIDRNGNPVGMLPLDAASDFSEGLAAVRRGKTWGYVDTTGAFVIQPAFEQAGPFSEGLAAVRDDNKWGYIDKSGQVAIPAEFEHAGRFSGSTAPVQKNSSWGYIDRSGKLAVEPTYDLAEAFSGGMAAVMIDRKWGYIDDAGKLVINPVFDAAMPFTAGIAAIQIADSDGNLLWGYIDTAGHYVVKPAR